MWHQQTHPRPGSRKKIRKKEETKNQKEINTKNKEEKRIKKRKIERESSI